MDDTSFSNILSAWGNGRWYFEGHSTLTPHEEMSTPRSESSGSMSPDLGEIWAYGCPKSPTCGSQSDSVERSEVNDNEDEDENASNRPCEKAVEKNEVCVGRYSMESHQFLPGPLRHFLYEERGPLSGISQQELNPHGKSCLLYDT